jgi:hypothetical protein
MSSFGDIKGKLFGLIEPFPRYTDEDLLYVIIADDVNDAVSKLSQDQKFRKRYEIAFISYIQHSQLLLTGVDSDFLDDGFEHTIKLCSDHKGMVSRYELLSVEYKDVAIVAAHMSDEDWYLYTSSLNVKHIDDRVIA